MVDKVGKLTPEQEDILVDYRARWMEVGLSTGPLDFEAAKAAIIESYEAVNLPLPIYWIRFKSPLACAVGQALVKTEGYKWFWNNVDTQYSKVKNEATKERRMVRACKYLDEHLDFGMGTGRDNGRNVWNYVTDCVVQVLDGMLDEVFKVAQTKRDAMGLWNYIRRTLGSNVSDQVYGCHDASWLGFYDFFRKECDLDKIGPLDGLVKLAEYCGWWAPYERVVFMQDKPVEIHVDGDVLHNEHGPAVRYSDNFCVWCVSGVRVPEQVVMHGETQTLQDISDESNIEVRRVRIERFAGRGTDRTDGWRRYLTESKAKVVDKRTNDTEVTEEVLLRTENETVLLATCKTGRIFAIEVDPETKTCEQAQSYLWGAGVLPPLNILGRS